MIQVKEENQVGVRIGSSMPFEEIIDSIEIAFSLVKKERGKEMPQADIIKMENIIRDLEEIHEKYMNI